MSSLLFSLTISALVRVPLPSPSHSKVKGAEHGNWCRECRKARKRVFQSEEQAGSSVSCKTQRLSPCSGAQGLRTANIPQTVPVHKLQTRIHGLLAHINQPFVLPGESCALEAIPGNVSVFKAGRSHWMELLLPSDNSLQQVYYFSLRHILYARRFWWHLLVVRSRTSG